MKFLMTETSVMEEIETVTKEELGLLEQYIEDSLPKLLDFAIDVILAVVVFAIGSRVIKWLVKIVKNSMTRANIEQGVLTFISSLIRYVLYFVLILIILSQFGVTASSVIAVLGSAGLTIGLALQGSLSNFAGGVLILLLKPFVVGDYIIEDNHKNEGTVKEIQLFYTKLTTIDNKTIIIPNGMLTNNSLTNVTEKNERRLDLKIDISYESDLRKAKQVIQRLVDAEERIMKDQDILIFVDELGASSVVLGLRAWVKADDYWNVRWKLLEDIKLTMDKEGIDIPYQQLTVHMAESSDTIDKI